MGYAEKGRGEVCWTSDGDYPPFVAGAKWRDACEAGRGICGDDAGGEEFMP